MANFKKRQRKAHFWSSGISLRWDRTTMPMVATDLNLTKNEVAKQVWGTQNSERAGKVLKGSSTDMEDVIKLCNFYGIDICQFLLMDDGKHPVLMHPDELDRLQRAAMGEEPADIADVDNETNKPNEPNESNGSNGSNKSNESNGSNEPNEMNDIWPYLNDTNVGKVMEQLSQANQKVAELYERVVQLTKENAELRSGKAEYKMIAGKPRIVSDNDYI